MQITSVHNNWKDDVLNIDLSLGNICNYKCWYCWPGSNEGNYKWPDLDLLKTNITHLINHYLEHSNKKEIDIHFVGGEPTHWPKLFEFITFLKENFNCLISMTSNGSKKLEWWGRVAPYFDRIQLSCHQHYVDREHLREVCDLLYENDVTVSVSVMMDPACWNDCMSTVDYLKNSRHSWTIRYVELVHDKIQYTEEQKNIIKNHRARRVNWLWFWRHNKYYVSKIKVIDSKNKTHKFKDNEVLLKRLNNFHGWECSVGVNWIHVGMDGTISGTCGQLLYGNSQNFNLYSDTFMKDFAPNIVPAICTKTSCVCSIETNMPKKQISSANRVIPIYAD